MKRVGQLLVTLLAISIFLIPTITAGYNKTNESTLNIEKQGKAYRYNIQGWIYMHIEGEPNERGYQYGYLAADEISDSIERWKEFILEQHRENALLKILSFTRKNDPELLWNVYKNKAVKLFQKHVPEEYLNEMNGMVQGIKDRGTTISGENIEFEDILLMQFVQDTMYFFLYPQKRGIFHRGAFFNYIAAKAASWVKPIGNMLIDIFFPMMKFSLKKLPREYEHPGHCSAFIATGDYTKDGGIVAAHSTVFNPLIAERCNLILDVKPTKGNSFTMTTFPGSIWSQEDWYQNEKGIILTETELRQGPFNIREIPKGVRSRTAIQYSDNIDKAINILQKGNNGLIPNEWLIGDIKTGEIASLEQAYYKTPVKKTKSGFYWSCNVPHDKDVLTELWGGYNSCTAASDFMYEVYSMGRDKKFEELKDEYRGKVDVEAAKEILATSPICNLVTDGKITSSNLLKENGLQVYIGNPNGTHIIPGETMQDRYNLITDLPAVGWLEIYSSDKENIEIDPSKKVAKKSDETTNLLWHSDKKENNRFSYCTMDQDEKNIFVGTSSGELVILDKKTGSEKICYDLKSDIHDIKISSGNVFVGTSHGIKTINKNTKAIEWEKLEEKRIISITNTDKGTIFAGCEDGRLYALDSDYGMIDWKHTFDGPVYVSDYVNNKIFFTSVDKCYSMNKNGEILWDFETEGIISSKPVYKQGKVFFGSWDHKLYCLDGRDGSLIWSFETGWGIDSSPEISENTVFAGGLDNNLYALDKDSGELKWFFETKSAIHSKPVAYGDYVFFGSDDGRVYALDKIGGEQAWSYVPGYKLDDSINNYITSPILSDVAVDDGVLYFGINNGVYALDAQTFEKEEIKEKDELIGKNVLMMIIILLIIIGICLLLFGFYINKKRKK